MIENPKIVCRNYVVKLVAHRILWEYRMLKISGFPGELESFVEYWICANIHPYNDEFIDLVLSEVLERISVENASNIN